MAFASNALRNPDLTPDMNARFELLVFIAGVFEAAQKGKRLDWVAASQ